MTKLQYLRKKYKLTQTQVQLKIGVDQSDYSKIETGILQMTYMQCRDLVILFHTSMDYLAGLTDEEIPHLRKNSEPNHSFYKLRYLREKHNITQRQIEKAIGINQSNYSKLESGKRYLNYTKCKALAMLLHTSMDYLADLTDEESPYPAKQAK